jgi:hypothetical protein
VSFWWIIMMCVAQLYQHVPQGHCYPVTTNIVEEQLQEVLKYFNVFVTRQDVFSRCQVSYWLTGNIKNWTWKGIYQYRVHIIIICSTAVRGPWPSTEASASWSIQLLFLQILWWVFSRVGLSAPRPPPGYPGGQCFLSGLSLLAD